MSISDQTSRRLLAASLGVGVVLTLVVAYRVANQSLVLGSREGRWVYEYIYGFVPRSLVVCGVLACLTGALLMVPSRVVRRREWSVVVLWLVVGTAAQLELRTLALYPIKRTFASDGSNGFYGATLQYPARVLLPNFDRLRPTLTVHPRGNMPGKVALVYALELISRDPDTLAKLVIVLSNAGGLLLYVFVRDLSGDPVTAVVAMAFYLFVPAKLFFFPVLNTVTPVLVIASLFFWLRALRSGRLAYAAGFGVCLFALFFYEPTPLVCGIILASMSLDALARGELDWRALLAMCIAAVATFIVAYAALRVFAGMDVFRTFRDVWNEASAFNAVAKRPYRIWVWRNLVDFAFGAGICQTLLIITVLATNNWRSPMGVFAGSVVATILVADLLGLNRGEVIRLWIFLACLGQVVAAHACMRLSSRVAAVAVLATSLLIGTLGTSMLAFAQP